MSRPVTIVGGGLAGLTLGIGLRHSGVPVTVYESGDYPRHRVCGEFISGRGQVVLERLGLLPEFQKAGAIFARTARFFSLAAQSPIRTLASPALCLSRYKMDATLAGLFRQLGGHLQVRSRWNSDYSREGTVSAAGRRLQAAEKEIRWFGLKAHISNNHSVKLDADLEMHVSSDGYVGINRINDGEINVCGLFRARADTVRPSSKTDWLRGRIGSALRQRLTGVEFEAESFCSVAGIQLKPQRALEADECCIGDALTMTPPVTGNGMSMAFESAEIAARPLTAYSRGEISWADARRQIAIDCDRAFSNRLAWARVLQWMMVAPVVHYGPGKLLLRSDCLWNFLYSRTR